MFGQFLRILFGFRPEPSTKLTEAEEMDLDDLSWYFPPKDVHNPKAWDEYWRSQFKHEMYLQTGDMFCEDSQLVGWAHKFGLTRVLCVGNGISMEPVALARAGLSVTSMDLSPVAVQVCNLVKEKVFADDKNLGRYVKNELFRPGGSVEFMQGDLFDIRVAPGPFDMIIERCTIQDYPEAERPEAVASLVRRLEKRGIIFSHCHDNRFNPVKNPGSGPFHATKKLLNEQGLAETNLDLAAHLENRVAVCLTSTG